LTGPEVRLGYAQFGEGIMSLVMSEETMPPGNAEPLLPSGAPA
jgi:hypothetical protein